MIAGNICKPLAALIALLTFAPGSAALAESGPKVAVVAFGLFGDQSVFESEAKGAAQIAAARFGGGGPVIVRANTKTRSDATPEALTIALDSAAKQMDPEHDILMVILTSHGSRAGLQVKAGGRDGTLSPALLAAMINQTGVQHRVVIISACYSGVFIPHLASADTLVITAADADHPSFGCQDGAQWTYFGDAFFNTAMRRTNTLKDAFAMARTLVRKREQRHGFAPSNPQMAGGANIHPLLKGSGAEHATEDDIEETADSAPWPAPVSVPWPVQGLAPWPE